MGNILSIFKENLALNESFDEKSYLDSIVPYYRHNNIDGIEFKKGEVSFGMNNSTTCSIELNDDSLISFSKNLLLRIDLSTLSFEDELRLFLYNLNCYTSKDPILNKISIFLKALVHFYLGELDLSALIFKDLSEGDLHGTNWQNSYINLKLLLEHHKVIGQPISINNVAILLSRSLTSLTDAVLHHHIDHGVANKYRNVEIFHSGEQNFSNFIQASKKFELIFLMSHGNDKDGLIYYQCKKANSDYIRSKKIQNSYLNAKLIFLVGCTRKPYEDLIDQFDYIGMPLGATSAFEFGEMFVKAFLQTYSVSSDIEMSLLSGQLSGKLFGNKIFEFGIYKGKNIIHDL